MRARANNCEKPESGGRSKAAHPAHSQILLTLRVGEESSWTSIRLMLILGFDQTQEKAVKP
jgi:hypothetical protein